MKSTYVSRWRDAAAVKATCLLAAAVLSISGCGEPAGPEGAESRSEVATGLPSAQKEAVAKSAPPADARRSATREPAVVPERYRARPLQQLSPEQLDEGWVELFDGQTLFGWQSANQAVDWRVQDGAIVAEAGGPGLLTTFVPFADFELRCQVRLQRGGNSGIFLRTSSSPQDPARDCYEWNLCDTHAAFPTGSVVGRHAVKDVRVEDGQWHSCRIRFDGPVLTAWVDGRLVTEFRDDPRSAGFVRRGLIGLQQNQGRVAFRRIFLKPLGLQPLLSREGLQGWRVVPGSRSRFEIRDGTLTVLGGPGYLQSEKAWADFALQFEAIVDGDGLNSGVFFRALPGTADAPANGYEVQIHNGFLQGDRSQPADAGTGAIFRRTVARWVVPDDHRWFHVTLVAVGDRFGVWVDGFPVTMWQDARRDDPNPRRGRRLLPGHLILQGHDPSTQVRFRRMRLADWSFDERVRTAGPADE